MGKKRINAPIQADLIKEKEKAEAEVKKEIKEAFKIVKEGRIYISCSYNNTILSITDSQGHILGWVSSGLIGFKGAKKATPFAASKVAEMAFQIANKFGIEKVEVLVKGIGSGRESAIRSLSARGLDIVSIKDVTPIPHNGCRPRKVRRV